MPKYSEQDLKYAQELMEEIHKEALAIIHKTHPDVMDVVDHHPVEEYFQEVWDYPGKYYTVVAIPYGYKNRKAFVDTIVKNTLSELELEENNGYTQKSQNTKSSNGIYTNRVCKEEILDVYSDLVLDYFVIKNEEYFGYESHKEALKIAFNQFGDEWNGDPNKATGKIMTVEEMFDSNAQSKKLTYRRAFLDPPHKNYYTNKDFVRVNEALFPNGTNELKIYTWTTDWSDYFDDGNEWWGTLCLTIYDKTLNRFIVIMASATD